MAALYLRSSKDRSDVSIDAQRRALTQLAKERGLLVVREYSDTVESGKDDDRPGFQALVADIRNRSRGWSTLLLHDTARLARGRYIAIIFEHDAKRHGVKVVYKSIPDDDPLTEMLLKSVMQAWDEYHSLVSRQKGLAGMAENVRKGYRAGGRPPNGYRLVQFGIGTVRDGEEVKKSKLEPDETSESVAKFLRLRARGVPRSKAARDAGISIQDTTLIGMEWNALTYAGHTVWNVSNEYTRGGYKGGKKRKPRTEWIIQKNTHPALITDQEAEAILGALEARTRAYARVDTEFLLAGLLVTPDGRKWYGEGESYRLRANGKRGRYVTAEAIEEAVWSQVEADTASEQFIRRLVDETRRRVKKGPDQTKALHKEVGAINGQISRMMELAGQMSIAAPALRKVEELERRRQGIVAEIERLDREKAADEAMSAVSADQVRDLIGSLMSGATGQDKRRILGSLVERITLDPDSMEARIEYRVEYRQKLASPRESELLPVLRTSTILRLAS